MKILLFQREYEAKRNPEPRSDYPFSRSKEDTLQQDMYQIYMKISSSDFLWQEPNKTITILSFQEIGTIATPSYKVPICIKTMQGKHPQGLLKLLQEKGFKLFQSKS